ncbi:MAG: lysophospholipid acyltransferase family protein [Bacillota bacterium]
MGEFLTYLLFKVLKFIVNLVPDKISYYLAQGLGSLLYHLVSERRELAVRNIKQALQFSEQQAQQLTKEVFQDVAIKFVKILKLEGCSLTELDDCIKVEGEEYLEQIKESDRGTVLFTGHFGNWELLGIYLSALGYPLTAIARDHKNDYIYQEIMKIRESQGAEIFNLGEIKKSLKALLNNKSLLILGDQDAHAAGEFVEFFDRPASTPIGPVKLAQRSNSYLVPVYLVREGFNSYRLIVNEPRTIAKDAPLEEQRRVLQELTTSLEDVIRDYPSQWLWLHRRWKTKLEECSDD